MGEDGFSEGGEQAVVKIGGSLAQPQRRFVRNLRFPLPKLTAQVPKFMSRGSELKSSGPVVMSWSLKSV